MQINSKLTALCCAISIITLSTQTLAQTADKTGSTNLKLSVVSINGTDTDESTFTYTEPGFYFEAENKLFKPKNVTAVEFGVSYFVNNNFAVGANLILPHKLKIKGGGNKGFKDAIDGEVDFHYKQMQVAFLGQYYFDVPNSSLSPYVGGGLNITKFSDADSICDDLDPGDVCTGEYKTLSTGLVLQAGLNYAVANNLNLSFDAKIPFSEFKFDALITNTALGEKLDVKGRIKQNPLIIGAGIGYSF